MPIYVVNPGGRLIRANTSTQAVNFAARSVLTCEAAKAETVVDMMSKGVQLEDARRPEALELPLENGDKPTSGNPESHTGLSTPSSGDLISVAAPFPPLDGGPLQAEPEAVIRERIHAAGADSFNAAPGAVDTVTIQEIDHVR